MTDISASEARKQFADLLRKASSGQTFTIVREGYPVATLGPPAKQLDRQTSNSNPGLLSLKPGDERPLWDDAEYIALENEFGAGSQQTIQYRANHRWTGEK